MRVDTIKKSAAKALPHDMSAPSRGTMAIAVLALVCITFVAYMGVLGNGFVNFDDQTYITQNSHIAHGLSFESIKWAFTKPYTCNWHPLTWLSHMLDIDLFGMRPAGHHLVNLAFHIANTLLLFGLLLYMTGRPWAALLVAAIFALHPLHVESVAWASERKDVLSTFFLILTLWMYASYARKSSIWRFLTTILFFACGLMSKPMLVTVPLVLLLLDYWPLGRWHSVPARQLILEKLPLFAMSAVSAMITIWAQQGAISSLEIISLSARLSNAVISYGRYLYEMLWPAGLAAFYPYPSGSQYALAAVALLILAAITLAVFRWSKQHRFLLVGWLWYLITLAPVIGLVRVGEQSHADRYTYVPLIGIFIAIAWICDVLVTTKRTAKPYVISLSLLGLLALAGLTHRQVASWKDTLSLSSRAVSVTKDNYIMLRVLGMSQIPFDKAAAEANLMESLQDGPVSAASATCSALAQLMYEKGAYDLAVSYADRALSARPDLANALMVKGLALGSAGQLANAEAALMRAIDLEPSSAQAYAALAMVKGESGQLDQGIALYRKALALNSFLEDAWFNLATLYRNKGDFAAAAGAYAASARLKPSYEAWLGLAVCLVAQNELQQAQETYRKAILLNPSQADAHYGLAVVLSGLGRRAQALDEARRAVTLSPGNTAAQELYQSLAGGQP